MVEHRDGRLHVLAHRIASQIEEHAQWEVVPEIASRRHVEALPHLIGQALDDAELSIADLDAVASTVTPGLVGSDGRFGDRTHAGGSARPSVRGCASPRAHLASVHLADESPEPPYLVLLVVVATPADPGGW